MAVGERRGVGDAGSATRTEVRVVERGIDALRSERRDVWRRCGRMVRVCDCRLARSLYAETEVHIRCLYQSSHLLRAASAPGE